MIRRKVINLKMKALKMKAMMIKTKITKIRRIKLVKKLKTLLLRNNLLPLIKSKIPK